MEIRCSRMRPSSSAGCWSGYDSSSRGTISGSNASTSTSTSTVAQSTVVVVVVFGSNKSTVINVSSLVVPVKLSALAVSVGCSYPQPTVYKVFSLPNPCESATVLTRWVKIKTWSPFQASWNKTSSDLSAESASQQQPFMNRDSGSSAFLVDIPQSAEQRGMPFTLVNAWLKK